MNWQQFISITRKHRYQSIVGQAFLLASELFDTPLPTEVQVFTQNGRSREQAEGALFFIRQMVELHGNEKSRLIEEKYSQYLLSLKSKVQLFLFALSILYPSSNDVETLKLPKYLHFLYFPLRPFLYLWRKSKKHQSIGGS